MFLALRDFDSKEDKIEVGYHNYNLMTERDFELDYENICRKLEIIPGISFVHLLTAISSKHQSSFLFSFKVELMLLLAILKRLESFG